MVNECVPQEQNDWNFKCHSIKLYHNLLDFRCLLFWDVTWCKLVFGYWCLLEPLKRQNG